MSDAVIEAMAREFARENPFFRKEAHLVDQHWPRYLPAIRAAIAAAEAMGWKMVREAPTEDMFRAGRECEPFVTLDGPKWTPGQVIASHVWRSMFRAAPTLTGGSDAPD